MATLTSICNVLDLDPSKHTTCIGYGQRNPDCRNPVAHLSRTQAVTVLETIARHWRAQDNLDDELTQLASLLLCKRNHQWQVGGKVEEWKRKLRKARSREAETENLRVPSSTSSAASSRASTVSTVTAGSGTGARHSRGVVTTLTNRELLKELKRRLYDDRDNALVDDFLKLADDVRDDLENDTESDAEDVSSDDSSDESDDGDVDDDRDDIPLHEHAASRSRRETATQQPTPLSGVTSRQDRPSAEAMRQARIAALSSSSTSASTSPSMPVRPASPIRQSHIECVVCLEPYDNSDEHGFWQCEGCLNRVHIQCFDCWYASELREGQDGRCPHCRAVV